MGRPRKTASATVENSPISKASHIMEHVVNPKNVELGSRIMIGIGGVILTYAMMDLDRKIFLPKLGGEVKKFSTSDTISMLIPGYGQVHKVSEMIGSIRDALSKLAPEVLSAKALYEGRRDHMIRYEQAIEQARSSGATDQLLDSMRTTLRGLQDTYTISMDALDHVLAKYEAIQKDEELIILGSSLMVGGSALWLTCHPEVVKEGVDALQHVMQQLIDEADQLMLAGGQAIKDALPDLWGLGW